MSLTPDEREELEAHHTFRRIAELELDPVRGNFDAAHLREIHRRIFQDLPGAGFDDVKPGESRPPVPEGKDWMKNRGLSIVEESFYVAYSRMDEAARTRLDKTLEGARPAKLHALKTAEFTATLVKLYAELDYAHPFGEGNSRTLRTFTRQLAKESGYELAWERFGRGEAGRDILYIARDRSVNALAKAHIHHEESMRKIIHSMDRLAGNRDLTDLLRDAVRPSRAVAFERLTAPEALREHPDLKDAYKTLDTASIYFESRMPGKPEAQQAALKEVLDHIQGRLNEGEIHDFTASREAVKREREAASRDLSMQGPGRS